MSNNKLRLFELADSSSASFEIISHTMYAVGGLKITCGNYTFLQKEDYNLENAINEMIKRLETTKLTKDQYIEILSTSTLNDDSLFPSYDLLRQHNIKYIPEKHHFIEYHDYNLNIQSLIEVNIYSYESYNKIDWSEFSHIKEIVDHTPREECKIGEYRDLTPYRVLGAKKKDVKTNKG